MKPVAIIGIAGGTGAGKSTLSHALFKKLGGEDVVTYLIHDNYYKDLTHLPLDERAKTNFDHPDSLDTELLIEHIRDLKAGKPAYVPIYDFSTHSRTKETTEMQPGKIILVEGILIFCEPNLVKEFDVKVFVDADSDIRLMRRLSRDTRERGRTVDQVLAQYHETVRPMHQQWVEPSKKEADLIVHSTGHSMDTAITVLSNHLKVVMARDSMENGENGVVVQDDSAAKL